MRERIQVSIAVIVGLAVGFFFRDSIRADICLDQGGRVSGAYCVLSDGSADIVSMNVLLYVAIFAASVLVTLAIYHLVGFISYGNKHNK